MTITRIPKKDKDLILFLKNFIMTLEPHLALLDVPAAEFETLKTMTINLEAKVNDAININAQGNQATAEKNDYAKTTLAVLSPFVKRLKMHPGYTVALGKGLNVESTSGSVDWSQAKPVITGQDLSDGAVKLKFKKASSHGVQFYCKDSKAVRPEEAWVLIGRATTSPFYDKRPLTVPGQPELRVYSAVYMLKNAEVGLFSDDLTIIARLDRPRDF